MNDDMTFNAGKEDFGYLAKPVLWQSVEDFRYDAPPASWALSKQTAGLTLLALWCLAALTFAAVTTAKMRVD